MRTSEPLAVLLQGIVVSALSGCGAADAGPSPALGSGGADHDTETGGAGAAGHVQAGGFDAGGTESAAGTGTGVAGAGTGGVGGGGGNGGAAQGGAGSTSRPSTPTCDDKGLVSFVDGMSLPTPVDFLGVYLNQGAVGVAATLYASKGAPCSGAADQAVCQATLVSGAPTLGFTQYYLQNTTSRLGNYSYLYLAYTRGDSVGFVSDRAQLNALLGPIDTANEAGLVFLSMGIAPDCAAIIETDDAYYFTAHSLVSPCSLQPPGVQFSVTHAGLTSSAPVGMATPCVGRRPDGLLEVATRNTNPLGDYYASIAYLEQAAVLAFDVIEAELARFGAPRELRDRARRARADEVRHASQMARLARRWQGEVACAHAASSSERSLLAAAIENAVEGCVREAWGALSAHFQAATTCDLEARAMWREIAAEESEHAELSFALHEWYLQQLSCDERAQIEAAAQRARLQLRVELAGAPPPHTAVVFGAGVPTPTDAVALFDMLERHVLAA